MTIDQRPAAVGVGRTSGARSVSGGVPVRADDAPLVRVARFLIEVGCLCFPAFINGAPLVFPDTRAYFLGGHAAIEKIAGLFAHQMGGDGGAEAAVTTARGVRSAFYSLFTYVPAVSVSIWLVIILQAGIVAAILRLAFGVVGGVRDGWRVTLGIAALSGLTTVSWATCNVMPDIFTPVMALAVIMLVVYWADLGRLTVLGLFLAVGGGMVMHVTNLPLALGLLVVGVWLRGVEAWRDRYAFLTAGGALVAGALAMLAVGVVGFKEWTLAPQSPPFLTARSIEDGPGRLYLAENCPRIGVLMCQHLDKLDQTTAKFIWDPDGVYSAVSPRERAEMRAEDKRIYVAAALAHPWMQAEAMGRNALAQLVTFGVQEYLIPSWSEHTADSMTLHLPEHEGGWATPVSWAEYLVVIGAAGAIVAVWGRLGRRQRQFALLVLATVVLEAAAGAVSEPVPRYEARVIWLVPLTAVLVWPGWKQSARSGSLFDRMIDPL